MSLSSLDDNGASSRTRLLTYSLLCWEYILPEVATDITK
jgi:hypothetical protein